MKLFFVWNKLVFSIQNPLRCVKPVTQKFYFQELIFRK